MMESRSNYRTYERNDRMQTAEPPCGQISDVTTKPDIDRVLSATETNHFRKAAAI